MIRLKTQRCYGILMFKTALIVFTLLMFGCAKDVDNQTIRLVITGNLKGAYKSCSCPKGQPGGLARRATIFKEIRSETPDAFFVDCGSFERDIRIQKGARTLLFELMRMFNYDVRENSFPQGGNPFRGITRFNLPSDTTIHVLIMNISDRIDGPTEEYDFLDKLIKRVSSYSDLIIIGGGGFVNPHIEERDSILVAYPGTYGSHVLVVDLWTDHKGNITKHQWEAISTKGVEPDSLISRLIDDFSID